MPRIFVHRKNIMANLADGGLRPVITVERDGTDENGLAARILDADGREVARVVYDPDNDRAQVWVETELEVSVG